MSKSSIFTLISIIILVGVNAQADFTLVTEEALGDVPANIPGDGTIAWPDWNNDGWPDLHIGPGILFVNNGDGTFTQVESIGLNPPDTYPFYRPTWADADNDGDLDCVQSSFNDTYSYSYYYTNQGPPDYTFSSLAFYEAPVNTRCGQPVFVDGNGDGHPEIYQGTFGNWTPSGWANDVYCEDRGGGIYLDVTATYIPELPATTYGRNVRGVVACDYDNDLDVDIFVPVYGITWTESWENYLWQNDGSGYFTDVASYAGVAIEPHGRYGIGLASGASWGDYDNDGFFDLIVANIHGWAALYHNEGNGTFSNVTLEAGLDTSATLGYNEKQWHNTLWIDMDNDGDLDLFLNQWYTIEGYTSYVYENRGPDSLGYFIEVTNQIGFNNTLDFITEYGFGTADYDRDGDVDVFMHGTALGYAGRYLYRNDLDPISAGNHWMVISLQGDSASSGLTALNAKIRLHYVDDAWSGVKQVEATSCDQGMNMHSVHFGLGDYGYIEEVVVTWPDGMIENFTWQDIGETVDQWITLVQGTSSSMTPVMVTLTPMNPPITIPATGGSFEFSIQIDNNSVNPQTFNTWIMVTLPDSTSYGPVLGPVNLTLPASTTLERIRTQYVPGSAPSGIYNYEGFVGTYPDTVWDNDSFTFEKLETGDSVPINNWSNSGEGFDLWFFEYPEIVPSEFELLGAYPNPFNPSTTIRFDLPGAVEVRLTVYDIAGREVAKLVDGFQSAGSHSITFDGTDLSSGIYFARLNVDDYMEERKLLLLK